LGTSVKKIFLATAIATLGSAHALAADLAPHTYIKAPTMVDAAYNWSGFYIGLNAGGAFGKSDPRDSLSEDRIGEFIGLTDAQIAGINSAGQSLGLKPQGFTGGGQFGYNWQVSNIVTGVEIDLGSMHLNSNASSPLGPFPLEFFQSANVSRSLQTDWLMTARGRLGWAVNNLLFYGTGGVAVTKVGTTNAFNMIAFRESIDESTNTSQTKAGYVLGAGIEYGFAPNWTIKGEYLHLGFGNIGSSVGTAVASRVGVLGDTFTHSANLTVDIARIGVNYRFGAH
jgi:outer membrane immunogenic protein